MDQRSGQKRASDFLYPPVEPFDQRMMDMGDGHQVYVEQCGNPDGVPVIVFHGGPGGGCSPLMRRYFDPRHYRVVLFDQRGCGRSVPRASVIRNTTWDLVADVERIREALGIGRYIGFGGSWGATLALITAITHPGRVSNLVLRGVFLMTRRELTWFYGGGAGAFFPELWQRFIDPIPEEERGDLIAAYHRRLFSGDRMTEIRYARIWSGWENALASISSDGWMGESPADYAHAFARLENHYFINGGFLDQDGWIVQNRARIADIDTDIVQGRYDMVCPPQSAWNLAEGWAKARVHFVPLAGHALSEPGISEALVRVMDRLR
ncbi:prolyl aminopeptidase [Rhodobacter sp. 24-YEA-8]|uniref:prolyl aminopeptidase n=1 Tax=Rhodobacter sp. 24-YEA-8 TaxID=1884310 RepID=UPI00089D729E|nr:prolyl aminopeptidase [Rhodobacter sp. 24-YEA-8]SEC76282.1 prolyl aminopeptidase Serine peptidase. MEROPS family S33 [Rhodobacter sp. 24-YEA-8]